MTLTYISLQTKCFGPRSRVGPEVSVPGRDFDTILWPCRVFVESRYFGYWQSAGPTAANFFSPCLKPEPHVFVPCFSLGPNQPGLVWVVEQLKVPVLSLAPVMLVLFERWIKCFSWVLGQMFQALFECWITNFSRISVSAWLSLGPGDLFLGQTFDSNTLLGWSVLVFKNMSQ